MILDFSQNNMFIVFEVTESNDVALKHFSSAPMGKKKGFKRVCDFRRSRRGETPRAT